MKKKNDYQILVEGKNYSSILGLVRSLGQCGYKCCIVNRDSGARFMLPDRLSKYAEGYYQVEMRNDEDILGTLHKIAENAENKMLLISVDDYSASLIDSHYSELSSEYYAANINGEENAINTYMNKILQKRTAAQVGLPTVKVWSGSIDGTGGYEYDRSVEFPCIVKPRRSILMGKKNIRRCDSEEELTSHLHEISLTHEAEIIIEGFLDFDEEICAYGVSTSNGVFIPGFVEELKMGKNNRLGVSLLGRVLDASRFPETVSKLKDLITKIGYRGLFCVDCLKKGDTLYFSEINFRVGASMFAFTQCGVNIPEILARDFFNNKGEPQTYSLQEKTFFNEKTALEEFRKGRYTREELEADRNQADFILNKTDYDPMPWQLIQAHYLKANIKGFLGMNRA